VVQTGSGLKVPVTKVRHGAEQPKHPVHPCSPNLLFQKDNHHSSRYLCLLQSSTPTLRTTSTNLCATGPHELDPHLAAPATIAKVDILALQSNTYGGGSVAVAVQMAQPNAEPVEEYEYVPRKNRTFSTSVLLYRLLTYFK